MVIRRALTLMLLLVMGSVSASSQEGIGWVFTDYPPANFKNDDGEYSGFLYDIIIEVFETRLDIPVDLAIFPWNRCQFMVEHGMSDMILTIPTEERMEYAVPTESPVWIKRRIVYTYDGHPEMDIINGLRSLEDIERYGFTVISYVGNQWVENAVEGSGIDVLYANSVENMYRMLGARRGDLIIEEVSIAATNIDRLRLMGSVIRTEGIGAESGFHLLIGKQSQFADIMARLNREIDEMWQDGTIEGILREYGIEP